jgi:hypothetical protein
MLLNLKAGSLPCVGGTLARLADIARFIEFIRAKWSRSQRRASVHGASGGPNDSRDGDLRAHLLVTEIGLAPSSA